MNYSRAGGPTPVNKPGVDKRIDDKMEILLEQQKVIEEAIDHYSKKVELKDNWYEWHVNALDSYLRKYDRVKMEICNASGVKYEPTEGKEAKAETSHTGEDKAPRKEEIITSEKPQASKR